VTKAADLLRLLQRWPSRMTPLADLLCFPGAGAGASVFRSWLGALPSFAALAACQLPGREQRIDEPALVSLSAAADLVCDAWLRPGTPQRPVILFGHSMGGVLAFETACRLAAAGRPPHTLVIAASAPPLDAPVKEAWSGDDAELRRLLLAYDQANRALISNQNLFESIAPTLRADIAMLRRHRIEPAARPAIRTWLLAGQEDAIVPPARVALWADRFSAPPVVRTLPGGHFFPFGSARRQVLEILAKLLGSAARPAPG
jgi:pyochelin biosynthesis protein PchC